MTLTPNSIDQLREQLPKAKVVEAMDLSAIGDLIEHVPEDMTATAQAGMTLGGFKRNLPSKTNGCRWIRPAPPIVLSARYSRATPAGRAGLGLARFAIG